MKYIYNPVTQTLDETAKIGEKIESTTPTQPRTDSFNNKPNPQVTANLADPNRTSLSSSDIVLASFNPKEALEFTGGYDKEKINLLKEVKDKARKQKDINNKKPITSLDYINRMQHRYGEAELNESNKMKDAALAAANNPLSNTNPKPILTEYEKQILRSSDPKSRGVFQKLVKEDEKIAKQVRDYSPKKIVDVEKTLEKYEDDYVSKRGDQTIALTNTANKLKGAANKNDYILKEDRNGLMVNKNRTIAVRDSFVAKQFNNALGVEPEATPEQFGKLAERLEKDRQMRGEPTNVQRFEKNFKNINSKKPIIKKPIKRSVPIEPVKINFDDYKPFVMPFRIEEDPRSKIMEARFKEIQKQTHDEKIKRETSGLAGLIGSGKKFI